MITVPSEFLDAFFDATHNVAWPDHRPDNAAASFLARFLDTPRLHSECPLILPRKASTETVPVTYVICADAGHATRTKALLDASVAHSMVAFTGRTASLNERDPAEAAILRFVGAGTTFKLAPPDDLRHKILWTALGRLVESLATRPTLAVAIPRPVGRLLRDFEASLSAGQAETSSHLLREIETTSGISWENLAFLTVRRLSKLGQDDELLSFASLDSLVRAEPPTPIRDGVLGAWSRQTFCDTDWDSPRVIGDAIDKLTNADPPVGLLIPLEPDSHTEWSPDSLVVVALAALARPSSQLAASVLHRATVLPASLTAALDRLASRPDEVPEPAVTSAPPVPKSSPAPDSWLSWLESVLADPCRDARLSSDLTVGWVPAQVDDAAIAELITTAPDNATDALLAMTGPFLEAEQYLHPAWRTAAALIERTLVAERFAPGELGVLSALVGVAVRGAPPAQHYRNLLADVQGFAPRWVSAAYPSPTLDLVDALAGGPIPDTEAASGFATAVLSPLKAQERRLGPALRKLASLLCSDLGVPLEWSTEIGSGPDGGPPSTWPDSVLLYSLNEAALRRASLALTALMPNSRIVLVSDKVGSPRLRDQVRNADMVVLTTQCATHAATGFITEHMPSSARLVYPDGPGAGSLLRAVETELELC